MQYIHIRGDEHVPWTYNVTERPLSPIARSDGSALSARCTDFVLEHEFFEHWAGHPVASTWGGCRGVDRLKR